MTEVDNDEILDTSPLAIEGLWKDGTDGWHCIHGVVTAY